MSEQWYYSRDNKQLGPVALADLQGMAQSGELQPADLVWTGSMPAWAPASSVSGLSFGDDVAAETITPAALSYSAPQMDSLQATDRAVELLRQTRPWVRLISVLIFIGAGFTILAALILLVVAFGGGGRGAAMAIGPVLVQLVASILYIIPATFLYRYADRISVLQRTRRTVDMEMALQQQKSFWMFVGIFTLVMIGLTVAVFLLAIVAAMMAV